MIAKEPIHIHLTAPDLCKRKIRSEKSLRCKIAWRDIVEAGLDAIESKGKEARK